MIIGDNEHVSRRINKVLESIFDDAWTLIEQREYQRQVDATKFVSAQHTSSTIIQVKKQQLNGPVEKR